MITKQDLLEAIAECKGVRNPTANTCVKLASYLTILEHLEDAETESDDASADFTDTRKSGSSAPNRQIVTYDSGSDFSGAIKNKLADDVFSVLDDAMSAIGGIHRKLYDAILQKLNELGQG